jgi:uncharacterized membrane protein YjjP (DUF1212 family)
MPPVPGPPSAAPTPPGRTAVTFLLELARALHAHGTPAHRLEIGLLAVASRLGLRAEFFSTPTSILFGFGDPVDQQVHLLRVEPGAPNLGHLARLGDITREVIDEGLSPEVALHRMRTLLAEPPRWSVAMQLLAYVLSSASVACFLHLRASDVLIAALLGIVTGGIALISARVGALSYVAEPLAAFVVTTVAIALDALTRSGAGYLTSLAGLVVLLPGLTFTVALAELSSRHLASGTARLSGALVTFLGLAFGLALGAKLGAEIGAELRAMLSSGTLWTNTGAPLPVWAEWAALFVAPLSFMVLLKADPRDAGWIIVACAAAYITSRYAGASMGEELGAFLGALMVSAGSNLLGRFLRRSPMVTLAPGLLILVPGSIGFRSVTSMIGQDVELGVAGAFRVSIIGISLAAGLLAGNVVASGARRRKESSV